MFFKIVVFKNFADFLGKHLYWIFYWITLQTFLFSLKIDSKTRFFPVKFRTFLKNTFLYRISPVAASGKILKWRYPSWHHKQCDLSSETLKVQSCMIALTQITNMEIFAFMAALGYFLSWLLFKKIAYFTGKLLQNYK